VINRTGSIKQIRYAFVILITGLIIYFVRAWRNHEWPFGHTISPVVEQAPTN
jgi:hypothetical protein